jgi:hypothetical protein
MLGYSGYCHYSQKRQEKTVCQMTTQKTRNTRGSVYLLLAMKKLMGRYIPLTMDVIQVIQLHNRAICLCNTLCFGVQETQDAWFMLKINITSL